MKNKYVLDASALLALINEENGHEKVANYLPEACVSTVNFSEVVSILYGISMPHKEIKQLMNDLVHSVIPFDEMQAYQTAELKSLTKVKGLSLGDRACIALGKIKNIPVITADKVWSTIKLDVEIILIR
jgi:PIN domain nuclease of toxin-antitoxin system